MRRWCVTAVLAAILPVACGAGPPTETTAQDDSAITVASFNFPESVLRAEIYARALESAGFRVELNLGTRELVQPALQRRLVEFVPEYAGSALEFVAGAGSASPDETETHRELARALAARGIAVLPAAPAEDQNGFAVTSITAGRFGLRTISDQDPLGRHPVGLDGHVQPDFQRDWRAFHPTASRKAHGAGRRAPHPPTRPVAS